MIQSATPSQKNIILDQELDIKDHLLNLIEMEQKVSLPPLVKSDILK